MSDTITAINTIFDWILDYFNVMLENWQTAFLILIGIMSAIVTIYLNARNNGN